ncbi:MAG: immunoglobulin domain-containing protein [Phycisphaerales bacterium]|nr:immunoglobulin domain-containing protein [Phycisphaerales bacterium]
MNRNLHVITSALALSCLAGLATGQVLVDLGKLPGGTWNYASTLSDDGSVVCGSADVAGGKPRAYRWTASSGLVNLGIVSGADHSYGYSISGNGLVVIGDSGLGFDQACRWTQATGMVSIGGFASNSPSFAFGANSDGTVIVGDGYMGGLQRAFRWTQATGMQAFGQILAGCDQSLALGITPNASHLFGYCYHNAPQLIMPTACRWDAAGNIISLGVLAGSAESVPGDCNADASVIVGYCADMQGQNARSFRWSAATGMQELLAPAGMTASIAGAITADATVITGYGFESSGTESAIIWINGVAQRVSDYLVARGVNTAGWTLRTADISAGGTAMAGWGIHNGVGTSWYINLGCADAPSITSHPLSQTISLGSPVTFSIVAAGPSLQYQWYKNNAIIPGAIASSYTINSVTQNDAGDFFCMVSNSCGSISSNTAILTVDLGCVAPTITGQPASQTVNPGSPATFGVTATGTDLEFQWFLNGSVINGAIAPNYSISAADLSDEGEYTCLVFNACGDDLSAPATLTISNGCDPTITDQPDNARSCPGSTVVLSLAAVGDGELGFQWRKGGEDIFGANAPTYTIWSATPADSGIYDCVVENDCGHVVSDAAIVTVCAADFNCDAFVNALDYDQFAELFELADPGADINLDGFVNALDYDTFASAFEAGC